MIKIDPTNSNRVWVAVYGPVWKEGGERGLYLTEDGGKTWVRNFHVSDNTGCNEVYLDPNMPGTMYAAFHQRRRHEWTYLGGGPESALYKSTDNGKSWRKLAGGLPAGELGRITIATTTKAGQMYAMVEAEEGKGGIFISYDYGESWSKQNPFFTAGNYYQEIFVDPTNPNRLFCMDSYMKVSDDAGKPSETRAKAINTLITTSFGSIQLSRRIGWSVAMVDCTKRSTMRSTGTTKTIFPLPSFIALRWITHRLSTTSTAVRRTTTPLAVRSKTIQPMA